MEPEGNLWVAVLAQAVRDAETLVKKVQEKPELWGNHHFRSEVRHLKEYFRSRSTRPGGFGFICGLMDVDPDQAAKCIEKQYLRHLEPASKSSASLAA